MNEETVNVENIANEGGSTFEQVKPGANLPAKVSVWKKLKDFLLQDASKDIEWTPKQQKFVDFWSQEVTGKKIHDFFFQEITFKKQK